MSAMSTFFVSPHRQMASPCGTRAKSKECGFDSWGTSASGRSIGPATSCGKNDTKSMTMNGLRTAGVDRVNTSIT